MKILVCTDGEPHSSDAIERAIALGLSLPAEVTALHVVDPWLKQFYNELYSQGRRQYLEYVDDCLRAKSEQAGRAFREMCLAKGLQAGFKVRHGEPLTEIQAEVREAAPDFTIIGRKPLSAWGRFRSGNLPLRLSKKLRGRTSVLLIDAAGAPDRAGGSDPDELLRGASSGAADARFRRQPPDAGALRSSAETNCASRSK